VKDHAFFVEKHGAQLAHDLRLRAIIDAWPERRGTNSQN
jgi:hypothetical protein